MEAYNELSFGCLDPEVAVLQQDKAESDEARRRSDGGDTSGDCSDGDSGSVAELVVEGRQGPLQPLPRKRVLRVESALLPGGLAPKRLRKETRGQFNQGRRQKRGKGRRRGGVGRGDRDMASGACQGSEWNLVMQTWLLADTP